MTEFFASPDDLGEVRSSELQSSLSERLGAEAMNALDPQSGMSAMQIGRRLRSAAAGGGGAGFAPPVDLPVPMDLDTTTQDAAKAAIPDTSIEDAKARVKQEGLDGQLPLPNQPSIKSPVLDLMIQEAHERADREAAIARHPGFVGDALGLATSLGAGMIDPVNLAAFSIPVLGEARMGKMFYNAGDSILARTGARLMQGGAQGAVGAAVLQPADWWLHTLDGRDYTMADALHSVLMSAGMGAAFHSAIGGAGDVRARMKGRPLAGSPADLVARGLMAEPGAMTQASAPEGVPVDEVPGVSPAPEGASEAAPRAMPELEQSVQGDVFEQLRAAGVSEEEAQANAAVVAARYATRAQRLGLDPDKALELYKSEGIEIQPGEDGAPAEGRAYAQGGPAAQTPEFKNWFGDSKVFGESGQPLIVYRGEHGETANQFHSRAGSLSFGSREAADQYAQHPNDRKDVAAAPRVTPAYLKIEKPFIHDHQDPFVEFPAIEKAIGREVAIKFVEKHARYFEGTNNWEENFSHDFASVKDLVKRAPEKVSGLYGEAYPLLDDPDFVAKLKDAGYDGAIYGGSGDTALETEYRVFSPEQVKSAIGNNGEFNPKDPRILYQRKSPGLEGGLFADREAEGQQVLPGGERIGQGELAQRRADAPLKPKVGQKAMDVGLFGDEAAQSDMFASIKGRSYDQATGAPVFYSAAERAIEASRQEKAPADQWLGMLRNATGVKPEEMEWLGLADWLKEQKGSVSKQAIADYVRANQIKVEEVQKAAHTDSDRLEELRESPNRTPDEENEFWRLVDDANNEATDGVSAPKFEGYQLPGGENYRELLLTLPEREPGKFSDADVRRHHDVSEEFWNDLHPTEKSELRDTYLRDNPGAQGTDAPQDFKGSHWDEPNVLAHVRFNDRTIDGKRALFLEEIQSDWHQQGKRNGYRADDLSNLRAAIESARLKGRDREVAALENLLAERETGAGGEVPDAPFKTTWPELSLKRVIRYAAENGYDHVAWTPGEVQAARYDLSKRIARVEFRKSGTSGFTRQDQIDANPDGRLFAYDHAGKKVIDQYVADTKGLGDYVGKDVAEKLLQQEGRYSVESGTAKVKRELAGLELKVGGEGMNGFYDKILPAAANKLVKKFGAKVETATIETTKPKSDVGGVSGEMIGRDRGMTDEEIGPWWRGLSTAERDAAIESYRAEKVSQPVHSIEITPELRKAALEEGFRLFQGAGDGAPRGRITLDNNRAVVQLFKEANASTFMHEAGHLWLDELVRDAAHPNAPIGLGKDLRTVLSWLGVDKPEDIGVEQHEQWARGFEQYLAEGRAPSSALGAAFAKFKAWLTAIYRNLTELGRPIPDEIKGVMDRMLATDEEIAAAPGRHPAEILADLPPRAQEDVVRAAMADMIEDRPVRASELLKAAATVDPRIAESLNGPAAEEPPLATVHMGPKAARGPRAKDPDHYSLLEFLADRGGLKPNGELATVFGGKPKFVPGFGPLLRKAGMTLDHAREAAVEAGYITDAGAIAGRENESSINQLLDLIDQEARGSKVYRGGQEPPETKAQASARDDERQAHYETEFAHALDEVGIDRKSVPDKTWGRVLEIMNKEHVSDPLIAYEQAVMEESHYGQEVGQGGRTEQHIPGWDVPDDAGAAHGGRRSAAADGADGSSSAARQSGAGDRAADWRALADSRRAVDDPDAIAESKEAAATPEPASIDPDKTVSAAEAAAKQADDLWKEIEPTLSEHERDQFNEVLQNLDREKVDRENIIREGAACLAAAVA